MRDLTNHPVFRRGLSAESYRMGMAAYLAYKSVKAWDGEIVPAFETLTEKEHRLWALVADGAVKERDSMNPVVVHPE